MKKTLYLLLFVLVPGILYSQGKAKYIFYFIGDGMGVNQVNITEMYRADAQENRIGVIPLHFTQFPVINMATTYCTSSPVTDSAAAGTALATGKKTYSGAIGVDVNKQPLLTIAEQAKKSGKKVGITTSVSIDHATPAAFYAHQPDRGMYYEIALDLPKANLDFYAGSGFLRSSKNYRKEDVPGIFPIFEETGYTLARGYEDYKAKLASARKMILIQEEGADPSSIPYAIDRKPGDLTLAQMTESALSFLTKENKKGFFLMVEGGKIDWACHDNDAANAVREVIDMDEAVKVALDFYNKHPKETLIVITADHETGGITLGKKSYRANLKVLQHQKQSLAGLSNKITELRKQRNHRVSWEEIKSLLGQTMGFWKEVEIDWENEKILRNAFEASFNTKANREMEKRMYSSSEPLASAAIKVMSNIAGVGWSSGDHSAGYVPVYAIGAGSQLFMGKLDNTDIPKRIMQAMK